MSESNPELGLHQQACNAADLNAVYARALGRDVHESARMENAIQACREIACDLLDEAGTPKQRRLLTHRIVNELLSQTHREFLRSQEVDLNEAIWREGWPTLEERAGMLQAESEKSSAQEQRAQQRCAWLDEMCQRPESNIGSDFELANWPHAPSCNTIKRWRSGRASQQDRQTAGKLAKALKVDVSMVPK